MVNASKKYMNMCLITFKEYLEYVKTHKKVVVEDSEVEIGKPIKIIEY